MNPAVLGVMIPILAIAGGILMAIIGTMTKHQQRMAELYRQNGNSALDARVDAFQRDVAELKDLVHRQTIALDRLTTPLPQTSEIRERIGG